MNYYFLALWDSIIKTLKVWWMYVCILILAYFGLFSAIIFLFLFVLGTKLYIYIDIDHKDFYGENLLKIKLKESEKYYNIMLLTQMIAIWGGLILLIISIVVHFFR